MTPASSSINLPTYSFYFFDLITRKAAAIRRLLLPWVSYLFVVGVLFISHAFQGSFWVTGDRIDYLDDLGFWAYGELIDGVLHHAGYTFHRA